MYRILLPELIPICRNQFGGREFLRRFRKDDKAQASRILYKKDVTVCHTTADPCPMKYAPNGLPREAAKAEDVGYAIMMDSLEYMENDVEYVRKVSRKSFSEVLNKVPKLEKIEDYNFYFSLFIVRFVQKMLHLPIDSECKFTAGWKFNWKNPITGLPTAILNMDLGASDV
ncbi:hypothetical protein D5282_20940 [bacterium 1xD8-48]|nr:hypothetical protein [bacterium 1xD8-48]